MKKRMEKIGIDIFPRNAYYTDGNGNIRTNCGVIQADSELAKMLKGRKAGWIRSKDGGWIFFMISRGGKIYRWWGEPRTNDEAWRIRFPTRIARKYKK